jgi:hypothetical protein
MASDRFHSFGWLLVKTSFSCCEAPSILSLDDREIPRDCNSQADTSFCLAYITASYPSQVETNSI